MKAALLKPRVTGAFVGLAAGDALSLPLAGLSREQVAALEEEHVGGTKGDRRRAALHGAVTTWSLAVLDALLYRVPDEPLLEDLAVRLCVLGSPFRGAALRGPPRSLAGTLRQVAMSLERDDDARLCGIDDVTAEGLCGALPLAFALGDDDGEVARALVSVVALTHRHVRVSAAAGLWVGGLRALLRTPAAPTGDVIAAAAAFARLVLDAYRDTRAGVFVGGRTEAEGAVALACAAASGASDPRELLSPPGYDGRDVPERIALAGLVGARAPAASLVDVATDRLRQGGDVDVVLPLLLASAGLAQGEDHLPLVLVDRAQTKPWVAARAACLTGERPPRLASLVIEELLISRRTTTSEPLPTARTIEPPREQLKLV